MDLIFPYIDYFCSLPIGIKSWLIYALLVFIKQHCINGNISWTHFMQTWTIIEQICCVADLVFTDRKSVKNTLRLPSIESINITHIFIV